MYPGFRRRQPSSTRFGIRRSEDFVDSFTTVRGSHTLKVGVEARRILLDLWAAPGYSISYATVAALHRQSAEHRVGFGRESRPRTQVKTEVFGYIQDEWKIKPNLTVNLGLRYDFFNEFQEAHGRTLGFSLQILRRVLHSPACHSATPTRPISRRASSLAWAPAALAR